VLQVEPERLTVAALPRRYSWAPNTKRLGDLVLRPALPATEERQTLTKGPTLS